MFSLDLYTKQGNIKNKKVVFLRYVPHFFFVMDVNTCKPVGNISERKHTLETLIVNPFVHIRQKEKIIPEIAAKNDSTCNVIVKKTTRQKRGNKIISIN